MGAMEASLGVWTIRILTTADTGDRLLGDRSFRQDQWELFATICNGPNLLKWHRSGQGEEASAQSC